MADAVLNRISGSFPALVRPGQADGAAQGQSATKHLPAQPPAPPKSWSAFAWIAPVLVIAAVAWTQPWKGFAHQSAAHESALASEAATARSVQIDRPQPAVEANVVLPATLRPWQSTTLHARINGYLKAWHRDLGSPVKAGELLAEIETPELDQESAQAEALALEADAAVAQARAERIEAEADLKTAEAQLARVQAEAELAKSQLIRREKLLASQTVTHEEFDTFRRQFQARGADWNAAKSDVIRRRANLQTRTTIIAAREATAQGRRASAKRLQELQEFKRIVAPFDGVVTRRTAELGMLVTAGQESLFEIEDANRLRVQVAVPQSHSLAARPGVEATVSVPEAARQATKGTITRTATTVDPVSRTMLVEIELDNHAGRFQAGTYAQVTLATPPQQGAWTIASNTVQMRVDGPHVLVVDARDTIQARQVTLGRDLGNRIIAASGLVGDERLVVNPSDDLTDGLRIRVKTSESVNPRVAKN